MTPKYSHLLLTPLFLAIAWHASAAEDRISLSAVIEGNLDGLTAEELTDDRLKPTIALAKKEALLTQNDLSKDPITKLLRKAAQERKSRRVQTAELRAVSVPKELTEAYWQKLNAARPAVARKTIMGLSSLPAVLWLGERALQDKTCWSADIAMWLGQQAEEYFPETAAIDLTLKLYTKTASCDQNEEFKAKSDYRFAMLSIWQNQCDKALPALARLSESALKIYSPRALYWQAQCLEKQDESSAARKIYKRLLSEHPYSHHAILVAEQQEKDPSQLLSANAPFVRMRSGYISVDALVRRTELLLRANEHQLAKKTITHLMTLGSNINNPEVRLYLSVLAFRAKDYLRSFSLAADALRFDQGVFSAALLKLLYPQPYDEQVKIHAGNLDPLLLTALIRQESAFNPRAHSVAGARGLMQLMPSTARRVNRTPSGKLYEPSTNIQVGSRYFSSLLSRFDGRIDLALASYNAGHLKVERWLKRYPTADKQLFAELIPYLETREYVSIISRNHYWYKWLDTQVASRGESTSL